MHNSVREIRQRLLVLLGRAFVIVLLFILLIFLTVLGYFLSSDSSPMQRGLPQELQVYYLGHGSWEGVEAVFERDDQLNQMPIVLVDAEQRIILDRRPDPVLTSGSQYESKGDDVVVDIVVDGEKVGALILPSLSFAQRLEFARGILVPIGIISVILAMFAFVVAIQLMRRFVNPLADVIYAARAMADGKLNTRIPSKGPQDLRSLSESFNEMAASLERADRERRGMLADIAHELRTPLSVIRGRLEGIVDGIYPENGSQVSMALEQTYLMQRLVDDLRLLTLVETGQLAFDKTNVYIGALIDRVLEMLSPEAQEKHVSLAITEKKGNLSANVDPQRFEQVISNLVGNAIRYVSEGGRVWLTANEKDGTLRITVNDNGPGILEEDLPFIFDRFWRKEKSRSRAAGGTGLGLAIVKQLVEVQGGAVTARNLPDGGLQIEIVIGRGSPA